MGSHNKQTKPNQHTPMSHQQTLDHHVQSGHFHHQQADHHAKAMRDPSIKGIAILEHQRAHKEHSEAATAHNTLATHYGSGLPHINGGKYEGE